MKADGIEVELDRQLVYAVDASNPAAWDAMVKICTQNRPGAVIRLTADEFDAIKESVIVLAVPPGSPK